MRELQGAPQSDRWLKNRLGRITASRIGDVMAYKKRGEGELAARKNYRLELVAERLTNRAADHYVSRFMEHGTEMEATAIENYELATKTMVVPVGFVLHPELDFTGATPDGLVGADGLIEVKCPKTETLLEWIDAGEIPDEHMYQMQWEIECTGRQWCQFYGFDDRLPPGAQHLVLEARRDDGIIAAIRNEVCKLNEEIEAFIRKMGLPATTWADEAPPVGPPEDSTVITDEDVDWLVRR